MPKSIEKVSPLRRVAVGVTLSIGMLASHASAASASIEKPTPTTTTPKGKIGTGLEGGKKPTTPPKPKTAPKPATPKEYTLGCGPATQNVKTPKEGKVSVTSLIAKKVPLYVFKPEITKVSWNNKSTINASEALDDTAAMNPKIKDIKKVGNNVTIKLPKSCLLTEVKRVQEPQNLVAEQLPQLSDIPATQLLSADLNQIGQVVANAVELQVTSTLPRLDSPA